MGKLSSRQCLFQCGQCSSANQTWSHEQIVVCQAPLTITLKQACDCPSLGKTCRVEPALAKPQGLQRQLCGFDLWGSYYLILNTQEGKLTASASCTTKIQNLAQTDGWMSKGLDTDLASRPLKLTL
eukprot:2449640-Amphidinium_carterae.1